jgi:hypothetical protein
LLNENDHAEAVRSYFFLDILSGGAETKVGGKINTGGTALLQLDLGYTAEAQEHVSNDVRIKWDYVYVMKS